jgi:hypothetical protein
MPPVGTWSRLASVALPSLVAEEVFHSVALGRLFVRAWLVIIEACDNLNVAPVVESTKVNKQGTSRCKDHYDI